MARARTEVTVNYATMDDTAIAGDDYVPVEGTLTFAPGETAKTIRVAVVDDAVDEADEESFAVTLSGHSGATLAHSLATGVIRDNDEPPALSVADAAGDEDVGTLEFEGDAEHPERDRGVGLVRDDGRLRDGGDERRRRERWCSRGETSESAWRSSTTRCMRRTRRYSR